MVTNVVPLPDLPERFLARLDAHLAVLPDHFRRRALSALLRVLVEDYARFLCTGRHPSFKADEPPHSSDFLLTICGLSCRLEQLRERERHVG